MSLQPLDINKVWFRGTLCDEPDWDNIKDPLEAWAATLLRDIDQLRLDLFGATYSFDNDGLPNAATSLYDFTTHTSGLPWIFSNTVSFTGIVAYSGLFGLDDSAGDHFYVFDRPFDLTADRNVTLPLLTANDTFVFANFAQTLDNKAVNITGPGAGTANVRYANTANDWTMTIPNTGAAADFVMTESVQTINGQKSMSDLHITGAWTAAGQTCADAGILTTVDINGGTWQGSIDGNWTAAGQTCASLGIVTTADINGGTWQGSIDGASNVAAGVTFSVLDTAVWQFQMANGTTPFLCTSLTLVTNLNADMLDGLHSGSFLQALPNHAHTAGAGDGGTLTWANIFSVNNAGDHNHSSITTGGTSIGPLTALTIANNVDVGAFSFTAANFISDVAIGTQPYACTSTTANTNLNADMVDGTHLAGLTKYFASSYLGNGANPHAITGVGFRPKILMIGLKGGTNPDEFWCLAFDGFNQVPASFFWGCFYNSAVNITGGGPALAAAGLLSIDADGFSVNNDNNVNENNKTYYYVALGN